MSKRTGDWFQTFTGKRFFPMDPRPEDIELFDIAHALAHICRFGGHCVKFYSVAQHSVIVSHIVHQAELQALMHDATEAYVGDMVRPLKLSMPAYREAEHRVWLAICERFDLAVELHPDIKAADNIALMTERRDLLKPTDHIWSLEKDFPPLSSNLIPLSPPDAMCVFLARFLELNPSRGSQFVDFSPSRENIQPK